MRRENFASDDGPTALISNIRMYVPAHTYVLACVFLKYGCHSKSRPEMILRLDEPYGIRWHKTIYKNSDQIDSSVHFYSEGNLNFVTQAMVHEQKEPSQDKEDQWIHRKSSDAWEKKK